MRRALATAVYVAALACWGGGLVLAAGACVVGGLAGEGLSLVAGRVGGRR